jgi:hypothetical protein
MPRAGSRKSPRKKVFEESKVIKHRLLLEPTLAGTVQQQGFSMKGQSWNNPNMPRAGSRKSPRKKVFEESKVIKHRLLLEPTLAGRRSRTQRRGSGEVSKIPDVKEIRQNVGNHRSEAGECGQSKVFQTPERKKPSQLNRPNPVTPASLPTTCTSAKESTSLASSKVSCLERAKRPYSFSNHDHTNQTRYRTLRDKPKPVLLPIRKTVMDHPIVITSREPGLSSSSQQSTPTNPPSCLRLTSTTINPQYTSPGRSRSESELTTGFLELLNRRGIALNLMRNATTLSSVVASTRLVRELYVGCQIESATAILLEDAETRGIILLTKLLLSGFLKPRLLGGLGFSYNKASLVVEGIILRRLADLIGRIDISLEALMALGLSLNDSIEIATHLREIGEAIHEKSLSLRHLIIVAGGSRLTSSLISEPQLLPL